MMKAEEPVLQTKKEIKVKARITRRPRDPDK